MSREKPGVRNSLRYRLVETVAGVCWFVVAPTGVKRCALPVSSIRKARASVTREFPTAVEDVDCLPGLARDLDRYFRGGKPAFRVKLDESGLTPFSQAIYRELRKVGHGKTVSYGELAALAGRAGAARGVGVAMARNPYPPIIPCHRVLTSSGALGGFSAFGGIELKRRMLTLEGSEDPSS